MDIFSPEKRSWLMSRVRTKDTSAEMTVRRLIFAMGFRYRLHVKNLPGCPDLVFPSRGKVIYVNGCFWHGHQGCACGRLPKTNVMFWQDKITRNQIRDQGNLTAINALGWSALTVWQCELKNLPSLRARLLEFLNSK